MNCHPEVNKRTVHRPRHACRVVEFTTLLAIAFGSCLPAQAQAQAPQRFEFREPHLGTIVEVTLYAPEEEAANQAARAVFDRIEELNRILSDYQPDSEAMRLCRTAGSGQAVVVSRELFDVLKRSVDLSAATGGAFDVTIGPLVKLWRTARRQRKLPDSRQLEAARQLVGWKTIRLNQKDRSIELLTPGTLLDFGGIAKGYIADEARAVLRTRGLKQCLIAVAGDIAAGDPPPGTDGWKIGVAPLDKPDGPPSRLLRLANCSISTSGDAFQFVQIDGVRYSHIVDPGTGLGLTRRSSVTVVAPDGATADGLATAVSILGPERGLKLIAANKETAALVVQATDDGLVVSESPDFAKLVIPPDKAKKDVSDKSLKRTWGTFSTCPFSSDSSTLETCSTTFVGNVKIKNRQDQVMHLDAMVAADHLPMQNLLKTRSRISSV